MTFIDLFAGVGGFRRGMELAGHECKGFCEWDKYATASYTSMHLITEDQRQYLSTLDKKTRQKEILKEEYRNGEWYSNDIRNVDAGSVPKVDCWCFGAPCQDFSVAGKRAGLDGDRSSLIREVFRIIREEREEDRPEWLIYENVKGMLSSNGGVDYLAILVEMDELGYDTEWQIFNSKNWGVPQNRERVYTIGHFRAKGERKVFPIGSTDGEDSIQVEQIGQQDSHRNNPNQYRVYSEGGVSPCLNSMEGGGREPHIPVNVSLNGVGGGIEISHCLMARDYKGIGNQEMAAVMIKADVKYRSGNEKSDIYEVGGVSRTLTATDYKQPVSVVRPVLTPEREEKRQNGRRFKDNGEPAFTLTAQDRHGVAISVSGNEVSESENISHCLNANDQRKVFGAKQERTMVSVPIKEATKQGYAVAHQGDSINLSMPNSKTRRGRVGGGGGTDVGHSMQSGSDRDDTGDYP